MLSRVERGMGRVSTALRQRVPDKLRANRLLTGRHLTDNQDLGVMSKQLEETAQKHADESLPRYPQVELAIIIPAFKELTNGNLAAAFEGLVGVNVPKDKVGVLVSVNNPRMYGVVAELLSQEKYHGWKKWPDMVSHDGVEQRREKIETWQEIEELLQQLARDVITDYQDRGWDLSYRGYKFNESVFIEQLSAEIKSVGEFGGTVLKLIRMVEVYRENQATIKLLRLITEASRHKTNLDQTNSHRINPSNSEDSQNGDCRTGRAELLARAQSLYREFSGGWPLPVGFKAAIRRGLIVVPLDNSSIDKAFATRDIGSAKMEGQCLALGKVFPQADYVHFQDADAQRQESNIEYVMSKIRQQTKKRPDVLILSQRVNARTAPEFPSADVMGVDIRDTLRHYLTVLSIKSTKYARINRDELGGSQLVMSRNAASRVLYPKLLDMNSDFSFSMEIMDDDKLQKEFSHSSGSPLELTDRLRPESIDGALRVSLNHVNRDTYNFRNLEESRAEVGGKIKKATTIENELNRMKEISTHGQLYQQAAEHYASVKQELFAENIKRRLRLIKYARWALPVTLELAKSAPDRTLTRREIEEKLQNSPLPRRVKDLLAANVLLVAAIINELKHHQINTVDQAFEHLAKLAPEYLVVDEQLQSGNQPDLRQLLNTITDKGTLPGEMNLADFVYLDVAYSLLIALIRNKAGKQEADAFMRRVGA